LTRLKLNIKKQIACYLLCIIGANTAISQNIGINVSGAAANASAMLDIVSTNKGFLIPRVALTGTGDNTTIASATTSLLVYNSATVSDVTPGYYYWSGAVWVRFKDTDPSATDWNLLGNATTVAATNSIGTTNNVDLTFRTNDIERMRINDQTLEFLNNGNSVYIGEGAGANSTDDDMYNVGIGYQSLNSITTAAWSNVGIGYQTLKTYDYDNCVAIGNYASYSANTTGTNCVVIGTYACYNATGTSNVAFGDSALYTCTTGNNNIAIGIGALRNGSNPRQNVAIGRQALYNASAVSGLNLGIGYQAGYNITSGVRNVAIGYRALRQSTTSNYNVAIGYETGYTSNSGSNVLIGNYAGYSIAGSGNVCIGYNAGYNEAGSNKLYIDNTNTSTPLIYGDFSSVWVGINRVPTTNCFEVSGGASKATAAAWLANSDKRIKTDIQDINNAIETIMKLRPVKFKYTDEWKNRNPYIKEHDHYYYNFIAQEYQKVFPESVQGSGEYIEGDSVEILQIDTYNSQIVAIKAIQEQQKIIEKQKKASSSVEASAKKQNIDIINEQKEIDVLINKLKQASSKYTNRDE